MTSRRRGRGIRPGEFKVFCVRGAHICMSGDAVKLWNGLWVCEDHYEARPSIDFQQVLHDEDPSVPWSRGKDGVHAKQFLQPPDSQAYVVCGFVEDGTDSFGGPNETAVTVTPGGTDTEDHVTPPYSQSSGDYVKFTGACSTHGADDRVVTKA